MKKILLIIFVSVSYIIIYNIGYKNGIGNQTLEYGATGFPKNCRALITANLNGVALGQYTQEEALWSIERNCGAQGYIWNER